MMRTGTDGLGLRRRGVKMMAKQSRQWIPPCVINSALTFEILPDWLKYRCIVIKKGFIFDKFCNTRS